MKKFGENGPKKNSGKYGSDKPHTDRSNREHSGSARSTAGRPGAARSGQSRKPLGDHSAFPRSGGRNDERKGGTFTKAPRDPNELDFGIRLVYEDETIIVIDKPAGILSVATPKESEKTAFKVVRDYLSFGTWQERLRRPVLDTRNQGAYLGVVHRLDRETSGIMFFVKTPEAREKLTHDWQEQVSDRRYLAVLEGVPKVAEGTIKNWLRQNKALRVYQVNTPEPGTEEAITHYKVIRTVESARDKGESQRCLVELKLETGRTNQIRVHMAGLGCPIVGDKKYGLPDAKGRLALHARRIIFTHPEDGRTMRFESALPPELKKLIRGYGTKPVAPGSEKASMVYGQRPERDTDDDDELFEG